MAKRTGWAKDEVLNTLCDAGIYPDDHKVTKHRDGTFSFRREGYYFPESAQVQMLTDVRGAFNGWAGRITGEVVEASQGMNCLVVRFALLDTKPAE